MKKQILLLGLSICCFAASAQPTSFAGITPGTTTRTELKRLEKADAHNDYFMIGNKDTSMVSLKQPENTIVNVRLRNNIVYEVSTDADSHQLEPALILKYGQPQIKIGEITSVNCQNKFGASFKRMEGKRRLLWPVKDGVQGELESNARGSCSSTVLNTYVLRHFATFKAVEDESIEKARREVEQQRRKLDGAL